MQPMLVNATSTSSRIKQTLLCIQHERRPCAGIRRHQLGTSRPFAVATKNFRCRMTTAAATPSDFAALSLSHAANLHPTTMPMELSEISEGLDGPIQLFYLLTLLSFLAVGAYLVVRQVLIRRELDEAAKSLGERIRTAQASCEVRANAELLQTCYCWSRCTWENDHSNKQYNEPNTNM